MFFIHTCSPRPQGPWEFDPAPAPHVNYPHGSPLPPVQPCFLLFKTGELQKRSDDVDQIAESSGLFFSRSNGWVSPGSVKIE